MTSQFEFWEMDDATREEAAAYEHRRGHVFGQHKRPSAVELLANESGGEYYLRKKPQSAVIGICCSLVLLLIGAAIGAGGAILYVEFGMPSTGSSSKSNTTAANATDPIFFTSTTIASTSSTTSTSTESTPMPELFTGSLLPSQSCSSSTCIAPECYCSDATSPPMFISTEEMPQLVTITFDDAINEVNYEAYQRLFLHRKNPNGCGTKATFYVSHHYTNYRLVQALYKQGHEIATHTVNHPHRGDWSLEIPRQRQIISAFANIPRSEIVGFRAPFLEPGGDEMLGVLHYYDFKHDSSFITTRMDDPMYPYTFDFLSTQDCGIGPCQTANSFPGLWEMPLTGWRHPNVPSRTFGMPDEYQPTSREDALMYLHHNFKQHYEGTRAPFGIYLHATWFNNEYNLQALEAFMDEVLARDDVYFVTQKDVVEYMKDPVRLSNLKQISPSGWRCNQQPPGPAACSKSEEIVCRFVNVPRLGEVYFRSCNECPPNYPNLDNPSGKAL